MDVLKLILLGIVIVVAYLSMNYVKPLTPGALVTGNILKVPYSWDVRSHGTPLAVITPIGPRYLRVTSFNVYTDGEWKRVGGDFYGIKKGGNSYVISITPFALLLYSSFPVPQPAPGTIPTVKGGQRSGDTFSYNGFRTTVIAKYMDPFPYQTPLGLYLPLASVLGKQKHWSTPRVQELAKALLEKFKNRRLYDLLNYMTNWLRKDYKYAFVYKGTPGKDPVDWFLFKSKTGMCVHFASATAVLLNDMGIKARVVYGYAVSYVKGSVRVFVTPTHAWVEVFVPNYGWVPWDPSPPQAIEINTASKINEVVGGSGGIQPPAPPRGPQTRGAGGGSRETASARWLTSLYSLLPLIAGVTAIAMIFYKDIKAWLFSWPLAFRGCVERRIGKRGLTLREVARITRIEELERVQAEYLRNGRWSTKGLIKAIKWCVRRWFHAPAPNRH